MVALAVVFIAANVAQLTHLKVCRGLMAVGDRVFRLRPRGPGRSSITPTSYTLITHTHTHTCYAIISACVKPADWVASAGLDPFTASVAPRTLTYQQALREETQRLGFLWARRTATMERNFM